MTQACWNDLPLELQGRILFEARLPSLHRAPLRVIKELQEVLVHCSPMSRKEFVQLCGRLPRIGISLHHSNNTTCTYNYATRAHEDADRLVLCLEDPADHAFQYIERRGGYCLLDLKARETLLRSRCRKLGVSYRPQHLLDYFRGVGSTLPVQSLFFYFYNELIFHGKSVARYLAHLMKTGKMSLGEGGRVTGLTVKVTEELHQNLQNYNAEMEALLLSELL